MRAWGFADAAVTRGGADGGVDVWSKHALAQVKFEAHATGRPALQRLYGARGTDHHKQLLFFTGTGYSRDAQTYADAVGVALFTYTPVGDVAPVSVAAVAIVRAAERANSDHRDQVKSSAAVIGSQGTADANRATLTTAAKKAGLSAVLLIGAVTFAVQLVRTESASQERPDSASEYALVIGLALGMLIVGVRLIRSAWRGLTRNRKG